MKLGGRSVQALVASTVVVALGAPLVVQSAAFGAGKPLSSVVLSKTYPGLVASSPGPNNGPVGDPGLHYLPLSSKLGNTMLEYIILHRVTGYLRAFSRKIPNGDGVFIFAFRYTNSSEEVSWLRGFNANLITHHAAEFVVPGIASASGFKVNSSSSSGATVVEYTISFDVGLTTFIMITESSSGDLTESDAISLAKSQKVHS